MAADERWLPPGRLSVELAAGFFLANLSGAAERSQTFEADLYLSFRWHDPRLAFDGTEPKRFLEDAAVERLKEICGRSSSSSTPGNPKSQTARSTSRPTVRSTTSLR